MLIRPGESSDHRGAFPLKTAAFETEAESKLVDLLSDLCPSPKLHRPAPFAFADTGPWPGS